VCVLSLADVVPDSKASSVILAILAVLSFTALETRTAVEESRSQGASLDRFTSTFPVELIKARESSSDIYLIGVDLARTIEQSYGAFDRNLRKGARIRILLTDPDASEAALSARHHFSGSDVEAIRASVQSSLRTLRKLQSETRGDLTVRTTEIALIFGVNFVAPSKKSAVMYVQMYSYRLRGESRPHLRLTTADGEWYDSYAEQVENLWADSKDFDFARVT
jgi:hypothetical protein